MVIYGGINGHHLLSRAPDVIKRRGEDGLPSTDAIAETIAETYGSLHRQSPTAWAHEVALRPFKAPL